jgi:hypothetical protein
MADHALLPGWRRRGLFLAGGLLFTAAVSIPTENVAVGQPPGKKDISNTKGIQDPKKQPEAPKKSPPILQPEKKTPLPPSSDVLVTETGTEQVAYINAALRKGWAENKLTPAPRCTDYEFIRRASLDLIGRIATPAEIKKFLADPPTKRRAMLIERLLAHDEFGRNFANVWTVLLMTRAGAIDDSLSFYHEQIRLWLEEEFARKDADWSRTVTDLLTATGKTNENGAVNFVLAHLGEPVKEDPTKNGRFEMVPVTSRTTRLFLGLRTQCTQCHDHPFNDEWKQSHFWGVNAFFRQVEAPDGRPSRNRQKVSKQLRLLDNAGINRGGQVEFERRSGVVLYADPTFLDGQKMPAKTNLSRRQVLAKFVTGSHYFDKAFVNRMWAHFFGRSFTKDAVDDFGEHNLISYPDLLDRLASDFAKRYNHNPRDLIRWICNSEAYGLSGVANKTNDKADVEFYFSRMLLKAMTPEQLFESLMVATQAQAAKTRENKQKLRNDWMKKLIVNFGDDEGNEANFNGTVIQALLMMNGQEINTAVMDQQFGTVALSIRTRAGSSNALQLVMTDLYLAALNRPPTKAEFTRLLSPKMQYLPRTPNRDQAAFARSFYQDLFWSLLNSGEFMLNH